MSALPRRRWPISKNYRSATEQLGRTPIETTPEKRHPESQGLITPRKSGGRDQREETRRELELESQGAQSLLGGMSRSQTMDLDLREEEIEEPNELPPVKRKTSRLTEKDYVTAWEKAYAEIKIRKPHKPIVVKEVTDKKNIFLPCPTKAMMTEARLWLDETLTDDDDPIEMRCNHQQVNKLLSKMLSTRNNRWYDRGNTVQALRWNLCDWPEELKNHPELWAVLTCRTQYATHLHGDATQEEKYQAHKLVTEWALAMLGIHIKLDTWIGSLMLPKTRGSLADAQEEERWPMSLREMQKQLAQDDDYDRGILMILPLEANQPWDWLIGKSVAKEESHRLISLMWLARKLFLEAYNLTQRADLGYTLDGEVAEGVINGVILTFYYQMCRKTQKAYILRMTEWNDHKGSRDTPAKAAYFERFGIAMTEGQNMTTACLAKILFVMQWNEGLAFYPETHQLTAVSPVLMYGPTKYGLLNSAPTLAAVLECTDGTGQLMAVVGNKTAKLSNRRVQGYQFRGMQYRSVIGITKQQFSNKHIFGHVGSAMTYQQSIRFLERPTGIGKKRKMIEDSNKAPPKKAKNRTQRIPKYKKIDPRDYGGNPKKPPGKTRILRTNKPLVPPAKFLKIATIKAHVAKKAGEEPPQLTDGTLVEYTRYVQLGLVEQQQTLRGMLKACQDSDSQDSAMMTGLANGYELLKTFREALGADHTDTEKTFLIEMLNKIRKDLEGNPLFRLIDMNEKRVWKKFTEGYRMYMDDDEAPELAGYWKAMEASIFAALYRTFEKKHALGQICRPLLVRQRPPKGKYRRITTQARQDLQTLKGLSTPEETEKWQNEGGPHYRPELANYQIDQYNDKMASTATHNRNATLMQVRKNGESDFVSYPNALLDVVTQQPDASIQQQRLRAIEEKRMLQDSIVSARKVSIALMSSDLVLQDDTEFVHPMPQDPESEKRVAIQVARHELIMNSDAINTLGRNQDHIGFSTSEGNVTLHQLQPVRNVEHLREISATNKDKSTAERKDPGNTSEFEASPSQQRKLGFSENHKRLNPALDTFCKDELTHTSMRGPAITGDTPAHDIAQRCAEQFFVTTVAGGLQGKSTIDTKMDDKNQNMLTQNYVDATAMDTGVKGCDEQFWIRSPDLMNVIEGAFSTERNQVLPPNDMEPLLHKSGENGPRRMVSHPQDIPPLPKEVKPFKVVRASEIDTYGADTADNIGFNPELAIMHKETAVWTQFAVHYDAARDNVQGMIHLRNTETGEPVVLSNSRELTYLCMKHATAAGWMSATRQILKSEGPEVVIYAQALQELIMEAKERDRQRKLTEKLFQDEHEDALSDKNEDKLTEALKLMDIEVGSDQAVVSQNEADDLKLLMVRSDEEDQKSDEEFSSEDAPNSCDLLNDDIPDPPRRRSRRIQTQTQTKDDDEFRLDDIDDDLPKQPVQLPFGTTPGGPKI